MTTSMPGERGFAAALILLTGVKVWRALEGKTSSNASPTL